VKDHWLPQFYLREFAIPGFTRKQDAEIWLTDLNSETCSIKKIQDIAQEAHFYSFIDANGKPSRRIDDKLPDLEDRASRAFRIIARGGAEAAEHCRGPKRRRVWIAPVLRRFCQAFQRPSPDVIRG
jgi:hypothetical protein